MPVISREPTLYTIGHANRSAAELIELLTEHGVARLVDVRSLPRSRHNPQFNRDDLADSLADAGIGYRHVEALGGLRRPAVGSINQGWQSEGFRAYADHMQTETFGMALEALIADIRDAPTAVMCAEALPWRCHRWLLSDAVHVRGLAVMHILERQQSRPHELTSFAEVVDGRPTYPFTLTPG